MSNAPITFRILLGLTVVALTATGLYLGTMGPNEHSETALASIEYVTSTTESVPTTEERRSTTTEPKVESEPRLAGVMGQSVDVDPTVPTTIVTTTTTAPTSTTLAPSTTATSKPKTTTTTVRRSTTTEAAATTTKPKSSSLDPSGPLTIRNKSGVVIENLSISNPNGPCIQVVSSSNVTIRNSEIGPCGSWAVFIDKSSSVTVEGNTIRTDSGKGGVYGHMSSGVAVLGNSITRSGRNPIQFDKVTGSGNRIESNTITSSPAEDMISIYKSGGTSGSWLRIRNNTVKNNTGKSTSGSGIMLGDAGGGYILVQGNKLTDPGQAGIGVAGGSNIRVLSNVVKSDAHPWSNVGIYVWDQYNSSCHSIEVRGNTVDWLNKNGKKNSAWNGGGCGEIAGWNDNNW
jgi:hypothetical protein